MRNSWRTCFEETNWVSSIARTRGVVLRYTPLPRQRTLAVSESYYNRAVSLLLDKVHNGLILKIWRLLISIGNYPTSTQLSLRPRPNPPFNTIPPPLYCLHHPLLPPQPPPSSRHHAKHLSEKDLLVAVNVNHGNDLKNCSLKKNYNFFRVQDQLKAKSVTLCNFRQVQGGAT